jgi:hypothetical protein
MTGCYDRLIVDQQRRDAGHQARGGVEGVAGVRAGVMAPGVDQ